MKQENKTKLLEGMFVVVMGFAIIGVVATINYFADSARPDPATIQTPSQSNYDALKDNYNSLDQTLSKEICERKGGKYTESSVIWVGEKITSTNCSKNGTNYDWQNNEWTNTETKELQ